MRKVILALVLASLFIGAFQVNKVINGNLTIKGYQVIESSALEDVVGSFQFYNDRMYVQNVGTSRSIDRTSDVVTVTDSVTNTVTETTIWTGLIDADDLKVGNVLKPHVDGKISNATAADDITINVYLGSTLLESFNPAIGLVSDLPWHVTANITIRETGASGSLAFHGEIHIGSSEDEEDSIQSVDTTTAQNLIIKVQWDNAKAGNKIYIYQGYLEWRN